MPSSAKREAPAAARNRVPIGDVLAEQLPARGLVLEVASGTGEHALYLAGRFPSLDWQPSDPDPGALSSIAAWREDQQGANLREPIMLDAISKDWPVSSCDAVLCCNMVHISPWEATEGLFAGAARVLEGTAPLILYGPYLEDDVETVPSNLAFDAGLRARNPAWGLRRLADIDALAARHRFERSARISMPANNLILVFRKG
ncbi:DUF938 domain-containing protein [Altererythrobacter arenosus]|uniref:DUF938 domain-containing protein n=1 Tax=Altererythrobacter arenosus TaxID=3032592 RepID=A0ABY8FS80_9SPHN|nr:DUF938 domain-containing protein [Altererythrobacter sp. CAU 1644]WFL77879.1 DUF938 domain-containing protein [Altererythrobacter sp. CAU 1644]